MAVCGMREIEETTPLKAALFESVRQQLAKDSFEINAARDNFVRRRVGGGFTAGGAPEFVIPNGPYPLEPPPRS